MTTPTTHHQVLKWMALLLKMHARLVKRTLYLRIFHGNDSKHKSLERIQIKFCLRNSVPMFLYPIDQLFIFRTKIRALVKRPAVWSLNYCVRRSSILFYRLQATARDFFLTVYFITSCPDRLRSFTIVNSIKFFF